MIVGVELGTEAISGHLRHQVLVAEFVGDHVFERAHLERPSSSRVEWSFVQAAEALDPAPVAFVFRARSPRGAWRLDPASSRKERRELAERLVESHLGTYRKLCMAGVSAILHTDFSPADAQLLRDASERVNRSLAQRPMPQALFGGAPASTDVDRWMCRHMTHYLSLEFEDAMARLLPSLIDVMAQRGPRLRAALRRLERPELASEGGARSGTRRETS